MNLKRISLCICCLLALVLALSACNGGEQPTETTPDTTVSTDAVTEAETTVETQPPVQVTCQFTLKDQEGNPMAGATFALMQNGEVVAEVICDDQGKGSATVAVGTYGVDYTNLPEYFVGELDQIELTETTTQMELAIKDTTPNGEADRPFFVVEDTTSITLPAGGTYHYMLYGGANRYLLIENTTATITYKENTYAPDENGAVKVVLESEGPRDPVSFAINNTTNAELTLTLLVQATLGSLESPIEVTALNTVVTATVPQEGTVYHKWVATMDGVLMVSSTSQLNNITMTNTRNSAASYYTDGSACEYIVVKAGDEVIIAVGAKVTDAATDIPFSLSVMAGTKDDPVVIGKDEVAIHFDASVQYVFSYATEGDKKFVISGSQHLNVMVSDQDETTYVANENGVIEATMTAGEDGVITFVVANTNADAGFEVEIKVK